MTFKACLCIKMLVLLVLAACLSLAASATSQDVDPRWTETGCFAMAADQTLLSHVVQESSCMTRGFCHSQCYLRSFGYFGLTAGRKCYCEMTLPVVTAAPDRKCSWKCHGNLAEDCGGDEAILVFKITGHPSSVTPTQVGAHGPPVGCFMSVDRNTAMRHRALNASCMTQNFCRQKCRQRSYEYFGLSQGTTCYCDHTLRGMDQVSDGQCQWRCEGNQRELCGSNVATLVFNVSEQVAAKSAQSLNSTTENSSLSTTAPVKTEPGRIRIRLLKLVNCSQYADLNSATCDRAIDGNVNQVFSAGSCSQGNMPNFLRDGAWWMASFTAPARVRAVRIFNRRDCCSHRLNDFAIVVGATKCASYRSSVSFSVKLLHCRAEGSGIRINSARPYLTLCEVQVFGKLLAGQ